MLMNILCLTTLQQYSMKSAHFQMSNLGCHLRYGSQFNMRYFYFQLLTEFNQNDYLMEFALIWNNSSWHDFDENNYLFLLNLF